MGAQESSLASSSAAFFQNRNLSIIRKNELKGTLQQLLPGAQITDGRAYAFTVRSLGYVPRRTKRYISKIMLALKATRMPYDLIPELVQFVIPNCSTNNFPISGLSVSVANTPDTDLSEFELCLKMQSHIVYSSQLGYENVRYIERVGTVLDLAMLLKLELERLFHFCCVHPHAVIRHGCGFVNESIVPT